MHKFAVTVTLVLCCSTGHAQYAPAELFYQQNVQRATVGTIHEYVPGSYHNLQSPTGITVQDRFQEEENLLNIQRDQSPTGITVQDRFPLTQPVLRSPTIQQSKAPQEATEEIKDRYKRELEVTLKHTRALNQRRANYNYGAKEDLDLVSVQLAINFANSQCFPWPTWYPRGTRTFPSSPAATVTTPSTAGGGNERVPEPIICFDWSCYTLLPPESPAVGDNMLTHDNAHVNDIPATPGRPGRSRGRGRR